LYSDRQQLVSATLSLSRHLHDTLLHPSSMFVPSDISLPTAGTSHRFPLPPSVNPNPHSILQVPGGSQASVQPISCATESLEPCQLEEQCSPKTDREDKVVNGTGSERVGEHDRTTSSGSRLNGCVWRPY
jgi:hypothetical protein